MRELVLFYGPNSSYAMNIWSTLMRMGIQMKNISPDMIHQKVGFLAEIPGVKEIPMNKATAESLRMFVNTPKGPELMVMMGFTQERLSELLNQLRQAGVSKSVLKAMVTETNYLWTFAQLYNEVCKEHESMEKEI